MSFYITKFRNRKVVLHNKNHSVCDPPYRVIHSSVHSIFSTLGEQKESNTVFPQGVVTTLWACALLSKLLSEKRTISPEAHRGNSNKVSKDGQWKEMAGIRSSPIVESLVMNAPEISKFMVFCFTDTSCSERENIETFLHKKK
ncbi:hypothetical protein NPIL_89351 [Nephila pilipes]|uniref:Uncharacterized protein n=1 Tax=Nephila pilipes TaxID=299642 RepID=A0A8X6N1A0_NEPPI|nr:hypothetical protein NPIL_89351 [Nephila pilipes]